MNEQKNIIVNKYDVSKIIFLFIETFIRTKMVPTQNTNDRGIATNINLG